MDQNLLKNLAEQKEKEWRSIQEQRLPSPGYKIKSKQIFS